MIRSTPPNDNYRRGWERLFAAPEKSQLRCLRCQRPIDSHLETLCPECYRRELEEAQTGI